MTAEEAPIAAEAEVQPDPSTEVESNVVRVKSLADLPDIDAANPDDIHLEWDYGGKHYEMDPIKTRYPENSMQFAMEYLVAQENAMMPEVGPDGKETYPKKGAELLLLRRECIRSPTWFHNEKAFNEKFAKKVPKPVVDALHLKLMLIAGVNGDFFEDFQAFILPQLKKMQRSASQNVSESSQAKSGEKPDSPTEQPTGNDSPSGTTSPDSASTSAETKDSPTPSGSEQSPTPTGTAKPTSRPIRPMAPSSVAPKTT